MTQSHDLAHQDPTPPDVPPTEIRPREKTRSLSTELTDVSEVEYRTLRLERVVLVGAYPDTSAAEAAASLDELAALAETAGCTILDSTYQRLTHPDPATYVGSGKAREVRDIVAALGADTVVCDAELTPGQLIHLEDVVKVKVIDRTALILDIFASHASSQEGRMQVELAQLAYRLPRLRGWGEALSRTGGGIGTRGPGETRLETDRRRINARLAHLRRELRRRETSHAVQSARRHASLPTVSLVGYTNAGKSSLMNALTGAGVLVEDALFATLDPTTRRTQTPEGRAFTLTDTVGFVSRLPHHLVDAFKTTLQEALSSSLLLHVVDATSPDPLAQSRVVHEVLTDLGPLPPEVMILNKVDLLSPDERTALRAEMPSAIPVSARTGEGLDLLLSTLSRSLPSPPEAVEVLLPYTRADLVSHAYEEGKVSALSHTPEGILLSALLPPALAAEARSVALPRP